MKKALSEKAKVNEKIYLLIGRELFDSQFEEENISAFCSFLDL